MTNVDDVEIVVENRDARDADAGYAPRPLGRIATIALDYRAVGLSVAGHPMERHRSWLQKVGALDSAALLDVRDGSMVIVAGLVSVRQQPQTAKGTVFLLLEDERCSLNVIVNKTLAAANREAVRHSPMIAVYGRAERSGGGRS